MNYSLIVAYNDTMTYTTLEIAKLTAKGVNGTELGCIVVLMP